MAHALCQLPRPLLSLSTRRKSSTQAWVRAQRGIGSNSSTSRPYSCSTHPPLSPPPSSPPLHHRMLRLPLLQLLLFLLVQLLLLLFLKEVQGQGQQGQ